MRSRPIIVAIAMITASVTGCVSANDDSEPLVSLSGSTVAERFPEVLEAEATFDPTSKTWTFDVTMSSPYDAPGRYADGWRVTSADGTVYGTHTLTHDHAGEQPFTRRQTGVQIPADIGDVVIEGRDLINGFGGRTVTIGLQNG